MSDSMVHLRRKISTAGDLQAVIRTMKAMAASSVTKYEQSVLTLQGLLPNGRIRFECMFLEKHCKRFSQSRTYTPQK